MQKEIFLGGHCSDTRIKIRRSALGGRRICVIKDLCGIVPLIFAFGFFGYRQL